jgi:hypothetical protein
VAYRSRKPAFGLDLIDAPLRPLDDSRYLGGIE